MVFPIYHETCRIAARIAGNQAAGVRLRVTLGEKLVEKEA